jgi:uncharacterized protein (DUF3084 family)
LLMSTAFDTAVLIAIVAVGLYAASTLPILLLHFYVVKQTPIRQALESA